MLTELPRIQSVSEICKMMKRTAHKQDEETRAWEQQPGTHGIPRYPDSVVSVLTSLFEYLFKFNGDNDPAILALGQSVQTHDGSVLPGLRYHTIYCRGILCVCVCEGGGGEGWRHWLKQYAYMGPFSCGKVIHVAFYGGVS